MPVNAALTLDFLERRGDIAVLDDLFPHPLSAFRFEEIRSYLDEFPRLKVFTTGRSLKSVPGQPGLDEVIAAHIQDYPNHAERILPSEFGSTANAHACYTVSLANAALFLDEIQRLNSRSPSRSIPAAVLRSTSLRATPAWPGSLARPASAMSS